MIDKKWNPEKCTQKKEFGKKLNGIWGKKSNWFHRNEPKWAHWWYANGNRFFTLTTSVCFSSQAWENHLRRNRSIVVDLFHGQLRSQVKCKTCGHISARFDPFNFLSLPLPMDSSMHLEITGEAKQRENKHFKIHQQVRQSHIKAFLTCSYQTWRLHSSTVRAASQHGWEVHGPEETAERAVQPKTWADSTGWGSHIQHQGQSTHHNNTVVDAIHVAWLLKQMLVFWSRTFLKTTRRCDTLWMAFSVHLRYLFLAHPPQSHLQW